MAAMADEDDWDGDGGVKEVNAVEDNVYATLVPTYINPKGYSKYPLDRFVKACYDGDVELLEKMLNREDPINGYHNDINEHSGELNALHVAAMNGQLEAVEMLLKAGADPHVKQTMSQGGDPKDGETAREMADKWGWDDVAAMLKTAEEKAPRGLYMKYGTGNNMKLWPIDKPAGLDPVQEQRARRKHKGLARALPNRTERKFYGDLVFGVTHGWDENGQIIRSPADPVASGPMTGSLGEDRTATGPDERSSSRVGLLFPGIGSQYKSMLGGARRTANQKVREMVATAQRIAGFDIVRMCQEGSDLLERPSGAEPAIYLASMASVETLRELRPEAVERPVAVAGLGLGEYSALTFAGVMDFEVGMQVVQERAAAIEAASAEPAQLMMSVAGIDCSVVAQLCEEARRATGSDCRLTNELFPKGCTCAGEQRAIEALQELAKQKGAIQTKIMSNSGAMHTPFMESARTKVEATLKRLLPRMRPPRCDVYMTVTGKRILAGTDPKDIIPLLCDAMTSRVVWQGTVQAMVAAGIADFYEVGPMKQLAAMMKRIDPDASSRMQNVEF